MGVEGVAIFVNGTVGVGKTITVGAMSELLTKRLIPHAVIDLDRIRQAWPAPKGDPFNHRLELINLKALASNYHAAGMTTLVIAGVIEKKTAVAHYEEILEQWKLFIVRLTATEIMRKARIRARHTADPVGRDWHLQRTIDLEAVLGAADLNDVLIDTSHDSPSEVAQRVFDAAHEDASI